MCRKNSVKLKLLARSHAQNGRCFLLNLPGQPYNVVIGALPFVMVCTHGHKPLIPLPLLALGTNTNIYIYSYAYVYIHTYIHYITLHYITYIHTYILWVYTPIVPVHITASYQLKIKVLKKSEISLTRSYGQPFPQLGWLSQWAIQNIPLSYPIVLDRVGCNHLSWIIGRSR